MSSCYRPGQMHWAFNGEFNLDYEDEWNSLSIYEKLCFIKDYFDKYSSEFEQLQTDLNLKEDSSNITNGMHTATRLCCQAIPKPIK